MSGARLRKPLFSLAFAWWPFCRPGCYAQNLHHARRLEHLASSAPCSTVSPPDACTPMNSALPATADRTPPLAQSGTRIARRRARRTRSRWRFVSQSLVYSALSRKHPFTRTRYTPVRAVTRRGSSAGSTQPGARADSPKHRPTHAEPLHALPPLQHGRCAALFAVGSNFRRPT